MLRSSALLGLEALGTLREHAKRNLERRREPTDGAPGRIFAATLEMGDPGRMQRRAVSELLLAEAALET